MPEARRDDEDDPLKIAIILRRSLGVLALLVFVNATIAAITEYGGYAFILYSGMEVVLGVAWVGLARGHTRGVAVFLVLSLYVAVTAAVAMFGGLRSGNALNSYLVIVALAGLVWNQRAALGMSFLVAASAGVIGVLQGMDALPTVQNIEDQSLVALWTGLMINVMLTGGILYLVMNRLRSAARESHRSEMRLAAVVERSPDGLIVVDDETLLSANPAAIELLGGDDVFSLGRTLHDAVGADETGIAALARGLARTGAGERVSNIELEVGPGSVPVELALSPFMSIEGRHLVLVTLHDLSERTRADAERAVLEDRLRISQKLEALGKLAGGIAHDFNNLLTIILGYGDALVKRLRGEPELLEDVEAICDAAARAAGLTRQLLAFSRRQPAQAECFDLNDRVRAMEKMLGRLLTAGVDLHLDLSEEPVLIEADPAQIEQVITNLIVNAHDSMRARGGRITVSTRYGDPNEGEAKTHVLLCVDDQGSGILPEIQPQIFDPFFTTKELGQGTGLGLSTVHGIVRQNGGEIRVESREGVGARFYVWLPTATREPETPGADEVAETSSLAPRTATILIAEDEPAVRRFLVRCLRHQGHTTLEAEDGAAALFILGSHEAPIDLVLSDVRMPGMGGLELIRRVQREYPESQALLISGYPEEDALLGEAVSVEILPKPIRADDLNARINELLGRRR